MMLMFSKGRILGGRPFLLASRKRGDIECTCFVLCNIPLFVLVFVITQW